MGGERGVFCTIIHNPPAFVAFFVVWAWFRRALFFAFVLVCLWFLCCEGGEEVGVDRWFGIV